MFSISLQAQNFQLTHKLRAFSAVQTRALKTNTVFTGNDRRFLIASISPTTNPLPTIKNLPEVLFAGRANVGKSSLLNAILNRNIVKTSKRPGCTHALNLFEVQQKLVLVDSPGYGSRGRPEWGQLFDNYVRTRKELRRVFVLISAKHGLNEVDRTMLQVLDGLQQAQAASAASGSRTRFTLQALITKADLAEKTAASLQEDIFATAPTCLPAIVTSAKGTPKIGVEETRLSILEACGLI